MPIDPPAAGQKRTLRITNVRMNASQVPSSDSSLTIPGLLGYPSLTGASGPVTITVPVGGFFSSAAGALAVAIVQQDLIALTSGGLGITILPQCQASNAFLFANPASATASYTVSVAEKEGFQSAFKRKNWATDSPSAIKYPASGDQNQNVPGLFYNSESAFENAGPQRDPVPNPPPTTTNSPSTVSASAGFPSFNGLINAGVADQGTRVALFFASIPSGVVMYVPTTIKTTSLYSGHATGQAVLVSTDINGAGPFSPVASNGGSIGNFDSNTSGLAQVPISGGSGMAVYEILYSDAFNPEQISVPIALGYLANQPATDVIATVTAAYAPFSIVDTADAISSVPRFASGGAQQLFVFKSCSQPVPTITASVTPNAVTGGSPLTFAATLTPSTSTGDVTFYLDHVIWLVEPVSGGVAQYSTAFQPVNYATNHTFDAVYMTKDNLKIASSTTFTVVPGPPYAGYIDKLTCQTVSGWAADRSRLNQSIQVSIYGDNKLLGTVTANQQRGDVGTYLSDNGLHGFSFALPSGVTNVSVRFEASGIDLGGSPQTVPCALGPSYTGYIDSSSCSGISGWAADKNHLGSPIQVVLWSGGNQIASATANASRQDVGAFLGDNGLHGFVLALPAQYADGTTRTVQIQFDQTSTVLGPPIKLNCSPPPGTNYTGFVDSSSCNGINGWAADKNHLNSSIIVSLWDGSNLLEAVNSTGSRPDVGSALGDNGLHGFSLTIPAYDALGVSHTFQVHYDSSTTTLGAPITLTCGSPVYPPKYVGYVDSSSCSGINGWAADTNRLSTPIAVTLWDGNKQIASTMANGSRSDVGSALGDNGVHGFSLALPSSYADGASHGLQVHYESSSSVIGSTVTLACGKPSNWAGYVDQLSCSTIGGWAADRNSLNSSIMVNVYDGLTLVGTIPANASRGDVGVYLSDNGLHGFGLATPASLKDGKAHTITVRPASSSAALGGAQSLTCQ